MSLVSITTTTPLAYAIINPDSGVSGSGATVNIGSAETGLGTGTYANGLSYGISGIPVPLFGYQSFIENINNTGYQTTVSINYQNVKSTYLLNSGIELYDDNVVNQAITPFSSGNVLAYFTENGYYQTNKIVKIRCEIHPFLVSRVKGSLTTSGAYKVQQYINTYEYRVVLVSPASELYNKVDTIHNSGFSIISGAWSGLLNGQTY